MSVIKLTGNQFRRFVAAWKFVRFMRQPTGNARTKLDTVPLYSFYFVVFLIIIISKIEPFSSLITHSSICRSNDRNLLMKSLKRGVNPFSRVVRQFIVHEDASVVWADRPWVLSPAFQEECEERVWNKSAKLQVPLVKFTLVFTEEMIQLLTIMSCLTLILLTWRKWWTPNNASKWQMGFNLAFKGLIQSK